MTRVNPIISKYFSSISKRKPVRPREFYIEMQKNSVKKRRENQAKKDLSTGS